MKETLQTIYNALDDKKGIDIKIIDIKNLTPISDYFIIASGTSKNQVQALADNVSFELSKKGIEYSQIEGYNSGNWILMDYNDFIIHIFDQDSRIFYDLERIWRDGEVVEL